MQKDLISRSALIEHIKEFTNINEGYFENPHLLTRVIENQPTACDVQNASWIYGEDYFEQEELYKCVEEALGFKLFVWQKTYIEVGEFRKGGFTTAQCLKALLDVDGKPLDYTIKPKHIKDDFYMREMRKLQEKLTEAGIPTRTIFWCEADKRKYNEIK